MSKDESSSSSPPSSSTRGLLSKVVRFVRNPTVNWSELDAMDEERESQYSKQMLKEMIERKRRNDFVRRREFDYLRKLRRSEGARAERTDDAGPRSSAFQTSMTSPDDRADTLRKIDEIEAQMSQQWWKGKGAPPGRPAMAPAPLPPAADAPAPRDPDQPAPASAAMASALAGSPFAAGEHGRAFAPTAPMTMPAPVAPPVAAPTPAPAMVEPLFPPAVAPEPAAAPAPHAAPAREKFVHDPDLEEAAIRFANADYDGAETALKDVLAQREGTPPAEQEHIWYTLFDLHRATGRQEQFEALSIDYAARFGRSAPTWFSIPLQLGLKVDVAGSGTAAAAQQRELTWNAPPLLTLQSIAALQASLARAASPWTLTWSRLTGIEPAAVPALAELLERWAGQDVQLRFIGVPALRALVQAQTPSGERSRDPQWWRLRMALLRVMGWADEFELAALDYCVTYEISPPSWTAPRCGFSGDADAPAAPEADGAPMRDAPDSDLYMTSGFALSQPAGIDEPPLPALVGHIEGDASAALQALQSFARPGAPLVVECGQLIRIDFAAVGGVLNWAATQQAAGQELEFRRLHRLVAVFFNVIGVNEHAWIVPRQD